MSCAAVTVNRSLILLAVVWGMIPVAAFQAVTMNGTDDTVALHTALESGHGQVSHAPSPDRSLPCQLGEEPGLLLAFSLAITQPNRKNVRVASGR